MQVHILIFLLLVGCMIAGKAGWIRLPGEQAVQGFRLFLLVALAGNILGLIVTVSNKNSGDFRQGYRMIKEETGAYEEVLTVEADGEKTTVVVEIPQKETENPAEEEEEEKPLTEEEKQRQELQEVIDEYNRKRHDPDYYYLPDEWNGKKLEWHRRQDTSGTFLAALSLAAGAALMVARQKEEGNRQKKRREQLFMDYPGLIMKFTLLVQAGMTARKAFQKMAADYRRTRGKNPRFAYEEIMAACYEMESGISEAEAYRRMGERCGQLKYKTFATLLIQNLQKGSRHLADLLEKESMEAWEERKRKARVLGEAAATKLLVPMVMMLAVVMALVMIPAFLSF